MKQTIFSFIPHVCYFSYHPWIAVSESRSLTTQEHQHPCLILLEFQHSPPSSVKTIKTEVDKRILACETLRLTLTFGGVTFKFVVQKIIHHCYCMLMRFFFFSIWVFFHEHSRFTGQQRKGEGIYLTPLYHFHPLHRHLDISRAITAESSPLHIAGSRTRTGNLRFPSASR